MNPLKFHVIIPTRERAETLYWTLKTCVEQQYENLEIWVSDNCSLDNTQAVVESFKDSRIHYIRTGKRVSMTQNFEFSLSHIQDGYIMFLGDDDGLFPGSIQMLSQLFSKYPVKAIMWTRHYYHWPNFTIPALQNKLLINLDNYLQIKNSKKVLKKALREFNFWILPNVYHAVVHIDCIKSIKEKHGNFFHCSVPDIYSSFVLAHEIDTYIHSSFPFSIVGYSKMSNHATFIEGAWDTKGRQVIDSYKEDIIPYHPKLECCISGAILFAEPYYQAKEKFPDLPDLPIKKIIKMAFSPAFILTNISSENYEKLMIGIEKIALKNNEMQLFNSLKKNYVHKSNKLFGSDTGYRQIDNVLVLDLEPLNITNIYGASKILGQLGKELPPRFAFNPIQESLKTYFKRGFYFLFKKPLHRFQ